jgi:radical SAM protein with 4Fe4S-binding SPASM domain
MDLGLFRGRILPFLTYLQKVNLQCFGEPLMSENFFAMAQDCKRKGCRVAFTTNGVLLPKYAQRVVETGIDFMTISIDGIDSLPAIRNISVSDLAEALQGLRDAQEQSRADAPFVCVNFTLMKDNARELSGVIDLCRRFGIRDLNVARIVVHSRLLEGKSAVDDSALREPLAEAREKAKRLGIMLSLPDPVGNVRRCTQPWEVMYINWNGDVRPCCMSTINENNALILGNVRDHTLAELWNCRAMRQLRLSLMKNGRPNDFCLNCPIRNCSSGSYTRILANG